MTTASVHKGMALAAMFLTAALGPVGDALTVNTILSTMTNQDFFDLANQPVSESEYLLASILPEELRSTYEAKSGSMRIITTPAGETGMDSPYTPVGDIELDAFSKPIAKWSATNLMTEQLQRELMQMVINFRAGIAGGNGLEYIRTTVVNWLQKIIRQSMSDRHELMRGEVLFTGQLVLRGGTVSYNLPAQNVFPRRTGAQAYDSADSLLWQDLRRADRLVGSVRARIMSLDTLNALIDSAKLPLSVVDENTSAQGNIKIVKIRRTVNNGQAFSTDARDSYTLVGYGRRVKIKVGRTYAEQQVVPDGKIAVIGTNDVDVVAFDGTVTTRPGLGRTHIGPTVENEGRPGYWMHAYTPQGRPMHAIAEGAVNSLTVIDNPEKLVILDSEVDV